MKKLISMLAVLCLLLALLPGSALAEETVEAGTWPDELPIVGLFENELERDCDDTGADGDSIDFGSNVSSDAALELPRDYKGAEIEIPLDTGLSSPVYSYVQPLNILPQDLLDQVRSELLPSLVSFRDILIRLF